MAVGSQPAMKAAGDQQKENRLCTQCGAPLLAHIAVPICPRCELRGALSVVAEQSSPGAVDATAFVSATSLAAFAESSSRQFGDYELIEEIARGGMGVIYRARQISLGRIVAVKMLLSGRSSSKDFVQRFRTESAAAASLQHPNIVAIHEVGFSEGEHFFAMDYVEGLTLTQLVAKGPLPAAQAARYVRTTAEAIHFAHERNVLHRDLKPSNVLIDSATGQPRVTDFGLAKRLESETELTLTGQVLGSPNFMSPEQAAAKRGTVGKPSDIYSLGAILYYLLTGRPPFQGQTVADVLQQVIHDDPLAPHLLSPQVPHDLETVCLKCLEKRPADRYQTAQELTDELNRFLKDEPIFARPVTAFEKGWRWCRRKPALASLAAALLLVLTLGFTGTVWQWRKAARYAKAEAEQRHLAEMNRDLALRNEDLAGQNIYDSDMSLAQHDWDAGDFGGTLSLLEAHGPKPGRRDRRDFEWFYFRQLCAGDQRWTSPTHTQAVSAVAFSPDGKRVALGAAGSPVEIWDCATKMLLTTFPEENVVSLAFGPDGQTLGVGGQDKVVVWNLETRRVLFKEEEPLARFRIALSPAGSLLVLGKHGGIRIFGKDGGSVEAWDYRTHELMYVCPESGGYVALSPRGDKLATGNWKGRIKIWDLATGKLITSLPTGPVVDMGWSRDGQTLATSLWGKPQVELWSLAAGQAIASLTNDGKHVWSVWSLAFSPDGKLLATGGVDQAVHLWDLDTRQETDQLRGHRSSIMNLAFSPDSRTLLSGSKDKTAMLWNVHPNQAITTVPHIRSRPTFSADGRLVAAGTDRGDVTVWAVATLQIQAVFTGARDALAFSDDGRALITRGTNYFLRTFNVANQTVRETLNDGPAALQDDQGKLSPNGQVLATGLADGTITLFDAKTARVIATMPHSFASNIFQLAFSPNSSLLAASGREFEAGRIPAARVWEVATQKQVALLTGHTDTVLGVAFSPDNKTLATCGADNSIKLWNTATWQEILGFPGHKEHVISSAFSPNGKRLASASTDGTLKLWNVVSHREVTSLKFEGWPSFITFSPDGQTLAALLGDSLRLWRAPWSNDEPSRIANAPR